VVVEVMVVGRGGVWGGKRHGCSPHVPLVFQQEDIDFPEDFSQYEKGTQVRWRPTPPPTPVLLICYRGSQAAVNELS